MEAIEQAKTFDCVKMMRDIRDRIDGETAGMAAKNILRSYEKALPLLKIKT
jgi:hypothetical protein